MVEPNVLDAIIDDLISRGYNAEKRIISPDPSFSGLPMLYGEYIKVIVGQSIITAWIDDSLVLIITDRVGTVYEKFNLADPQCFEKFYENLDHQRDVIKIMDNFLIDSEI